MSSSDILATLALVVSVLSLIVSAFFGARDRANLVTTSKFFPHWEDSAAHVRITIVNAGRRPVILRLWAGAESKENWVGTFLGKDGLGLRLDEHERYELTLQKHDLLSPTPVDDVQISELWFEDTLGRRHSVKGAKANIAKLWAA